MRYSIESRDQIYVIGYECLSLSKNMSTSLSSIYGQKILEITKKSATDLLKTASKKTI